MSNDNETKGHAAIVSSPGPDYNPSSTDPKLDMITNAHDIGATVFAEAQNIESDDLEGERSKVKKKLDRILMPMVSRVNFFAQRLHRIGIMSLTESSL